MRIIGKVTIVLFFTFLSETFFSACRCDYCEDIVSIRFDSILLSNLDHSGKVAVVSNIDSMMRAAVAFQVEIRPNIVFKKEKAISLSGLGFSKSYAFEKCDCAQLYTPETKITDFSIFAVLPLNSLPAGSDVSTMLNYYFGANAGTGLYFNESDLKKCITQEQFKDFGVTFQCFVPDRVPNDSVQFAVEIVLADNTIFRDTTRIIYIK